VKGYTSVAMLKTPPPTLEAAVLAANASFYRVFNAGDAAAMSRLWAEQVPVACFHPAMPALVGREAVMESWRQILRGPLPFVMRCDHARAHVLGTTAFVTCYEGNGDHPAHLAATNIFVLEQDAWKMVHHQAGPLQAPLPRPAPASTAN